MPAQPATHKEVMGANSQSERVRGYIFVVGSSRHNAKLLQWTARCGAVVIRAGVHCFKVEGRLKGPEYVAMTTIHPIGLHPDTPPYPEYDDVAL